MTAFKLTLAYDGTDYAGWQIQPNGTAIQELVERALERILGEKIRIHGSGRTDAGVHAQGQVAHFHTTNAKIPPRNLRRALNAALPPDIRILKIERVPNSFHARISAREKSYRYQIYCGEVMDPFLRRWATHYPRPLNLADMRRAARVLVGRRDFAAVAANPQRDRDGNRRTESTVRTLKRLTVSRRGNLVTITATADGFLYKMVRSLTGALMRVGSGKLTVQELQRLLAAKQRTAQVETAPPQGLSLLKVRYQRKSLLKPRS